MILVFVVVGMGCGLWYIIYLRYDTFLEFSMISAIYITSFDEQKQGHYSINILIKLDGPRHQEKRKRIEDHPIY